jgi:hypothetical protein
MKIPHVCSAAVNKFWFEKGNVLLATVDPTRSQLCDDAILFDIVKDCHISPRI